jgi:sulfur carrier protein
MTITINGKIFEIAPHLSLAQLLKQHGITADQKGIAVALNDEVVMKSQWGKIIVQEGDRLEIVRATQGG